MYRKSLYNKSDESLKSFSRLFNSDKSYPHLRFIPNVRQSGTIRKKVSKTFNLAGNPMRQ